MTPVAERSPVNGVTQTTAKLARWLAVKTWFWRRPEWWMLAISGISWALLIYPAVGLRSATHHHHPNVGIGGSWGHWSLMVAAMMFPLLIGQVRTVATRSLWRRRNRAIALYLGGYFVPWLVFGVSAIAALSVLALPRASAISLVIAALWQITPWKQRALRACHRMDALAPYGWRADMSCVGAGGRAASNCLLSCWALMLPCASAAAATWLMPVISAFTIVERTADRPGPLRFSSVLLATAAVAALV